MQGNLVNFSVIFLIHLIHRKKIHSASALIQSSWAFRLCVYSMAACSTLSDRGRKNASAGGAILKATVQQDKKYHADQNPTGIISLDNADNVFIHSQCSLYDELEKSLIGKQRVTDNILGNII